MPRGESAKSREALTHAGIWGKADSETASRARAAKVAYAQEDADLRVSIRMDPDEALLELLADLTTGTRKLMRHWLNKGGEPPKVLIDALREFRLASRDALVVLHARHGSDAVAEEFFATLDERMQHVSGLVGDPKPLAHLPDQEPASVVPS